MLTLQHSAKLNYHLYGKEQSRTTQLEIGSEFYQRGWALHTYFKLF